MKILRVIASMNPATGGPCQGIRYSTPDLRSMGCTNEVVCLDDPDSPYLCEDSFVIHALGRGIGPLCYHHRLFSWLKANISNYDAVIVHGLWLWPSMTTWLAIRSLKEKARRSSSSSESHPRSPIPDLPPPKIPPYFVMPHGMLDPWFQRDKTRRLKSLRNSIYWHLIEKRVVRDAESLLFTCEEELRLARTTFRNYAPKREINVGYGVPEPPVHSGEMDHAFHKTCPHLPEDQPYLLFLSRIHAKKGVDLLIRAYAEVFGVRSKVKSEQLEGSEIPADTPFEPPAPSPSPITDNPFPTDAVPALVIAGSLDSDYAQEMIMLAESLLPGSVFTPPPIDGTFLPETGAAAAELPSAVFRSCSHEFGSQLPASMNDGFKASIHFTGILQGDAKWGALYGCEAFVLPSHQENFGISVVEALSCGKAVLISDQVNIWREISAAGAGFSATDTREGIISLLKKWVDTPFDRRQHISHTASLCFEGNFHSSAAARNLLLSVGADPLLPFP